MRRSMAAALVLTVLLFGGAYLAAGKTPAQETVPDGAAQEQSPQGQKDSGVQLAVKNGDAVENMALDAYLQGVVRGEMPASFEQEALKAQAAAERTYVYYQLAAGRKEAHPQADVCTDPACCNAWLSEEAAREKWGGDFDGWERRIEEAGRWRCMTASPFWRCSTPPPPGRRRGRVTCGAAMSPICGAWTARRGRRRCQTITARRCSLRRRPSPCWPRPTRS